MTRNEYCRSIVSLVRVTVYLLRLVPKQWQPCSPLLRGKHQPRETVNKTRLTQQLKSCLLCTGTNVICDMTTISNSDASSKEVITSLLTEHFRYSPLVRPIRVFV